VKIIETDKSENKQVKAGQKTMDNFMKTSLLNTIMYTFVWIRENKIMRTVNHFMTLLIA
jgi:hypothetical protein